jgi:predicted unusual protein kinase regulating ubiquinone biosynthesis (AarF/ABC1/UbiB family)
LVEEHIQGIPGDDFIKKKSEDPNLNAMRLSKEFIKFNERCLVRLLGDMHSSNFVVEVIP